MATNVPKASYSRDAKAAEFKRIDYVEFYVGNALQAAHFFRTAFGFRPTAYTGLETNVRDRVSFVVEQRNIIRLQRSPEARRAPGKRAVRLRRA
jgi:4-hydroxyphenylpyruvate dioxygenase